MTHNQIEYWDLQEQKRSNSAREKEENRHNIATEAETNRSNIAKEQYNISDLNERSRHNVATEVETNRSNLQNEYLKGVDLNIQQQKADESKRHNIMSEKTAQYEAITNRVESQTDKAYKEAIAQAKKYANALKAEENSNDKLYAQKQLEIKQKEAETAYKKYQLDKTKANFDMWSKAIQSLLKIIVQLKTAKG